MSPIAIARGLVATQWANLKHATRHWPPPWNLLAALAGSLTAGLIMLQSVDLLDDFLTLFNIYL